MEYHELTKLFKKAIGKLYPGAPWNSAIFNIGGKNLPPKSKRALVIYSISAIPHFVSGKLNKFPNLNNHTRYWESAEMVRLLNKFGYIVDFFDTKFSYKMYTINWDKYDLVIDVANNLKNCPKISSQKKIYYATSIHWLTWNLAELNRIRMFKQRTGIVIPASRQIPAILSDEYADYLTYFGTDLQKNSFDPRPQKVQLDISAVYIPEYQKKNINRSRNKFLWLGGGGLIHKGLDIVIEAFAKMPEAELFIAGDIKDEPRFWQWAEPILAKHNNIHAMGWMDVSSKEFDEIANDCIGTVYASAAEGGPGSIAQAIHWGLVPIVTASSLVRAETSGYNISGETDMEMIESTIEQVRNLMHLPEKELLEKSDAVREFAGKHHTREAYSSSFGELLAKID